LLNASVGVQRVVGRLRPTTSSRPAGTIRFHRRSVTVARDLQVRAASVAATAGATSSRATSVARASVPGRIRSEGIVPVAVIAIVLVASVMSWLPGTPASAGPIGDTRAAFGSDARIALGGGTAYRDGAMADGGDAVAPGAGAADAGVADPLSAIDLDGTLVSEATPPQISGAFRADGTLVKPMAVNTAVADGKDLLRSYKVRKGDTLTGIANRFGVSMMTIWWANKLSAKDSLVVGQTLTIPPVNGLVYSVKEGDSLESLASRFKVQADEIYETNGLEDRALLVGQTLILPGAVGKAIETPPPPPPKSSGSGSGGSSGGTVRPPSTYGGGSFAWPVVGGGNQISQYFHYGHYGIDIAADYGSRVRSAAGGTVIFAGWKSNGGGYQVWIAHGSGLYTTYNHMSGVSVGRGQQVSRGQQVGRIGSSGWATGPHLHFEVWRGPIWNGGSRVNPLRYF
jgi:murein DD-endopeptidase MepM/ murein hydrolase activator NlpD